MQKQQVKKMRAREVLKLIYENELTESSLNDLPKEELIDFILEIFNKGVINDCIGVQK